MSADVQLAPAVGFPPALSAAVREAAVEFFGSYCGMAPTECDDTAVESGPGIMGVISFFGDPVWSAALVMSERTAVVAAKAFAGFDIAFDSPDMGDVVGEMANVMAGDIVARLDARGIAAQMSLPTVARGSDVEVLSAGNACTARLKFESPGGSLLFRLVKALDRLPGARRSGA